jgi:hypothetical protein
MPIIAQETRKADVRFPVSPSCDDARPPEGGEGVAGAPRITGSNQDINPGCYPYVYRRRFWLVG